MTMPPSSARDGSRRNSARSRGLGFPEGVYAPQTLGGSRLSDRQGCSLMMCMMRSLPDKVWARGESYFTLLLLADLLLISFKMFSSKSSFSR